MRYLAKLMNENFYYIWEFKICWEKCFLDALGGLFSLVKKLNLVAKFISDLRIKKMYCDWNFNETKCIYS